MNLILLLLALNPPSQPVFDAVDRVEINHVYSSDGGLVFDQIIFWRWDLSHDRWEVVDWRILKGVRRRCEADAAQWQRDYPDGPPYVAEWIGGHATPRRERCGWVSEWYDGRSRKWRRVVGSTMLETWTLADREIIQRQIVPESRRRRLR